MSERELTPDNVAEALGLTPKQQPSSERTPEVEDVPPEVDAQPEAERDEVSTVVDTEQQQQNEWLANHQRELRRMQEEHPENADVLAVMFGNPEQRQAEHDWLMRLHQPRKDGAA